MNARILASRAFLLVAVILCMALMPTFAQTTYTVAASVGANGSISPSGNVAVNQGDNQQFTITPNSGYSVADVKVDNVSVGSPSSYTFSNVQDNHTIDVTFQADPDLLFYAKSSDYAGAATWPMTVPAGNNLTRIGSPSTTTINGQNWIVNKRSTTDGFQAWSLAGQSIPATGITLVAAIKPTRMTPGDSWTAIVEMGLQNLMLGVRNDTGQVQIIRKGNWNSTAYSVPDGQITVLSLVLQTDGSYKLYANGELKVTGAAIGVGAYSALEPRDGWSNIRVGRGVDGWSAFNGNIGDVFFYKTALTDTKRRQLEMDVAEKFGLTTHQVTASAIGHGTISPSGVFRVVDGTNLAFTITPEAGYCISSILRGSTPQAFASPYTLTNITADDTVTASFDLNAKYEAEDAVRAGSADIKTEAWASGGKLVGTVGTNASNTLTFTVTAAAAGNYAMTMEYQTWGTRTAYISVNGGAGVALTCPQVGKTGNANWGTITATVALSAGANTIKIYNNADWAPDVDFISLPTDYVAYYKFDETSGTSAADSSGRAKTATVSGGYSWVTGIKSNGIALDGIDGHATLPNGILSDIEDFTIATWLKLDSNIYWNRIFDFGSGMDSYMFLCLMEGDGIRFAIKKSGELEQTVDYATPLETGVWKHVAVTKSGNTVTLYIDGVAVASQSNITFKPSDLGSTTQNWIGRSQYDDPCLDGIVDNFAIYNMAMSAEQVGTLASIPTITATAGAGGSITPAGAVYVDFAGSQTFAITPNAGYTIADVTVDGVSQGAIASYTFNNVTADHTISATFSVTTRTITASAGAGGTISPSGAVSVNYGSDQTFSITPNEGYRVTSVAVDGVSQGATTSYTFTNVTAAHSITASFANIGTIPSEGDLLLACTTSSLPTSGATGPWPTLYPAAGTMTTINSPTTETINGVTWEWNSRTDEDGFKFLQTNTPIACNGATIVTVVKPVRNGATSGWNSIVDVFYDRMTIGVHNDSGAIVVRRNGPIATSTYTIPDGQPTVLSYVVQPNGQYKVYANGIEVMSATSTSNMTAFVPNIPGTYANCINVGRNNPDGWTAYNGYIGDVFVYKTALSDSERQDLELNLASRFGITTYTITASAGANGTISPSGTTTVMPGTSCTVNITPDDGYGILSVIVDGVAQGPITSYTFSNISANHTISATFCRGPVVPQKDQLIGSWIIESLPDSGSIATWPSYWPLNSTLVKMGNPVVETIGGTKWSNHRNASFDGYDLGIYDAAYSLPCNGASIVMAVRPVRNGISATWFSCFNVFTYTLSVGIRNDTGNICARRNNTLFNYPTAVIPDGQITILSMVVQPDGTFKIYANGKQVVSETSTSAFTQIAPTWSTTVSQRHINMARSNGNTWSTFNGDIGDTYFYKTALTDSERQQLELGLGIKFGAPTYTITASAGAHGSISPSGARSVMGNSDYTFTITPDEHYDIADVLVDGVSQGAIPTYTFTDVSQNHTISATFDAKTYTITVASSKYGTITPSGAVGVRYGDSQTFTITPNEDCSIAELIVDGVSQGAASTYTFSNVDADHTIRVRYNYTRNVPQADELVFGCTAATLPTFGLTGPWPTAYPANGSLSTIGNPTAETIDGVTWESNSRTNEDGFRFVQTNTPIACNGGTIVTVVKPVRINIGGGWTSIVDVFYDALVLGIRNDTGQIVVRRNGSLDTSSVVIPDGQATVLSLVVQPDGQYKVYANGIEVISKTDTSNMTALVPGPEPHEKYINVGRNNPDGWTTFNGYIGDVYLYKVALNDEERLRLEGDLASDFNVPSYTIAASAGANGSISPSGTSTIFEGLGQTYNIIPASGYEIEDVTVDGVSQGAIPSYTFSNVTADHTISATFAPAPLRVVAHYKLDETSGAIAHDSSANVKNGTLNGGCTWVLGKKHNGLELRGTDGYVSLPEGIVAGLGDFTITTWVRLEYKSYAERVFDFGSGTDNYMFLCLRGNDGIRFAIKKSGGVEQAINANVPLEIGEWYHLGVTRIGNTVTLYINGEAVASSASITTTPAELGITTRNWIGRSQGNSPYLDGTVDDFAIYNQGLSSAAIGDNYHQPTITSTSTGTGTITPSGSLMFDPGDSQTYAIATVPEGRLIDVLVDGVSQGAITSYTFPNITTDHTIAAVFEALSYTITATVTGNGTISPSGVTTLVYGQSQTYTITPADGYEVADVVVDGVSKGDVSTYRFANINTNHTIAVTFRLRTFVITAIAGSGGTISPSGAVRVTENTNQTFTITPDTDYGVVNVLVDGVSQGKITSYTFTNVTRPHTISVTFASKLVLHYRFDEANGASVLDSSGRQKTGALTSGCTRVAGKINRAVNIPGGKNCVNLPSGVVFGLKDFSVSTWVKLNTRGAGSRIFDFGNDSRNYMELSPQNVSTRGKLQFVIRTTKVSNTITGTAALPTGSWQYVVVTKSGKIGTLYVNGVKVAQINNMTLCPNDLYTTYKNYIGDSQNANDPHLNGVVDDFKIYNCAMTAAEVAAGYSSGSRSGVRNVTTLSKPVVDLSASDLEPGELREWNNAGSAGGKFVNDNTTPVVETVGGMKAVTFGGNDWMASSFTAPAEITGNHAFTASVWAYAPAVDEDEAVLSWSTDTRIHFGVYNGVSEGKWHLITMTYDGTRLSLYVDRVLMNSEERTLDITPGMPMLLGAAYTTEGSTYYPYLNFTGSIGAVTIFDRAISEPEIDEMYDKGF